MNEFLSAVRRQVRGDLDALPSRMRTRRQPSVRADRYGSIAELRAGAAKALPRAVFDFVDGAANDEITHRRNQVAFQSAQLWPKVLEDVGAVDTRTTVLGQPIDFPVIGAPTGLSGLVHPAGEVGLAQAAERAGTVYTLSTMASYSIEEVAARSGGPKWFQLYVWRDRALVAELVDRAWSAGYGALVVTVDVPRGGMRERDIRNGFGIPPRVTMRSLGQGMRHPSWSSRFLRNPRFSAASVSGASNAPEDAISLTDYINSQFDPSVSWDTIEWLRHRWAGKLVVKGVLRAEDAQRAVDVGVDGVVVSNHGGRQLDTAPSAFEALPAIAAAVGGDVDVLFDSGVRRGSDVLKARCLGATACLIGRPMLYGLAVAGSAGAERSFEILRSELQLAMALTGCATLDQATTDLVTVEPRASS